MDGIIIIDKEKDYTSRDVVNIIGKKFKTKKVGHTGTLDPLATGVLVVCINKATKIAELLTCMDKEYIATFELGLLTDTLDITGNIISKETVMVEEFKLNEVIKSMLGEQVQTIPLYSAVKINGKKLYEYARNNEEVELPTHNIKINSIELLSYSKSTFTIKANVSKGTYIRALGEDIAKKLNTHASMTELRRTKQGDFDLSNALKIDDVTNESPLLSIKDCLIKYPKNVVDKELEQNLLDGKIIDNTFGNNEILFVDINDNAICLYKKYDKDETKIKPWKMFKTR